MGRMTKMLCAVILTGICTFSICFSAGNDDVQWLDGLEPASDFMYSFDDGPIGVFDKEKDAWYYINSSGERVGGYYDSVQGGFCNDLGAVKSNGKWGFIDATGAVVIPPQFDSVGQFTEDGLCYVEEGEKIYYINMAGEKSFELSDRYDLSFNFHCGRAIVRSYDENGEWCIGCIDTNGVEVIPCQYYHIGTFQDGFARIMEPDGDDDYVCGAINTDGEIIIPLQYENVGELSDGLIQAYMKSEDGKRIYHYYDTKGNLVLQFDEYKGMGDYSCGLASVSLDGKKYGCIDKNGELVIPYQYSFISEFEDGYAWVLMGNIGGLTNYRTQVAIIDTNGTHVISGSDLSISPSLSEGLHSARDVGGGLKEGFVDIEGNCVIDPIYDKTSTFAEGVSLVSQSDRLGLLSNPLDRVSSWAEKDVALAEELGLITQRTSGGYPFAIDRLHFTDLITTLAEQVMGCELDAGGFPFRDTGDRAVRKAAAAGLVTGTGGGNQFEPQTELTREQLATILWRTITYLEEQTGTEVLTTAGELSAYSDGDQVSSWARESVATLCAAGIIQGTSDTTLSPKDTTTVEQAILLTLRAYQLFEI